MSTISKSASSGCPLLLKSLLQRVILESFFDIVTLVAKLERKLMHVIIFIDVIAEGIVLRNTDTRLSVLSLCVIFAAILSLVRFHTNVLTKELICAKIVHEVLTVDESTLFVGVLQQNLVESLYHSLHDFLEAEVHSLFIFIVSADIFSELLIDFFDHSV